VEREAGLSLTSSAKGDSTCTWIPTLRPATRRCTFNFAYCHCLVKLRT